MFLQLNHQSLDLYTVSRAFVKECYFFTKLLPDQGKFSLVQQIRRAALSVHLNISEGCSRRSEAERKRFYEVARGSVIEIDAALDICFDLEYCKKEDLKQLGLSMVRCFSMLSKMINVNRQSSIVNDRFIKSSAIVRKPGNKGPFHSRFTIHVHSPAASNVFPWLMSPVSYPFLNQYILCADVPCVKVSGTT